MPHDIPELPELDLHPDLHLGALAHDPATGITGRIAGIVYWDSGWVVVMDIGRRHLRHRRHFLAADLLPGPLPDPEPPLLSVRLPWDVLRSMMRADRLNNNATEAERILLDALPKDVHDRLAAELGQ